MAGIIQGIEPPGLILIPRRVNYLSQLQQDHLRILMIVVYDHRRLARSQVDIQGPVNVTFRNGGNVPAAG